MIHAGYEGSDHSRKNFVPAVLRPPAGLGEPRRRAARARHHLLQVSGVDGLGASS